MDPVEAGLEEREALSRALVRGRKVSGHWRRHAAGLTKKYGGQWVAFVDGEVIAASRNPRVLERRLTDAKVDRAMVVIRFVPKSTDRFVL